MIVPESLMGTIEVGQQLKVSTEIPIRTSYVATVDVVDQVIDASSGTFGIRLILPNPGNKIHGGQRCNIILNNDSFGVKDKK